MMRQDYYQVCEMDKDVYRISSQEGVGMNLFVGEERALLWDTGYGFGNLRDTVRSITDKPLTVVNSHGHLDHCNGNFQFRDCPVYMNEKDWGIYSFFNSESQREFIVKQARHMITDWAAQTYQNILPSDFDPAAYCREKPVPLLPLNEGMRFQLGGLELDVLETPGHTWGSAALFRKAAKELYLADSAGSFVIMSVFGATPEALEDTVRKLLGLDFTRMLGAHESIWKERALLEKLLETLQNLDLDKRTEFKSAMKFTDARLSEYLYLEKGSRGFRPGEEGAAGVILNN